MPKHCAEINAFVLRQIGQIKPNAVFLHANWWSYKSSHITARMARTVAAVQRAAPEAHITLIGSVPQWHPSLPKVMLLNRISPDRELYLYTPLLNDLSSVDQELAEMAAHNRAGFMSPIRSLCVNERCEAVLASDEGVALTVWDDAHLTERASLVVAQRLLATDRPVESMRSNTVTAVSTAVIRGRQ
jgi:hypothetical protein